MTPQQTEIEDGPVPLPDRPMTKHDAALLAWARENVPALRARLDTIPDGAFEVALADLVHLWRRVHDRSPTPQEVADLFGCPVTWAEARLRGMFTRICEDRIARIDHELRTRKHAPKERSALRKERRELAQAIRSA